MDDINVLIVDDSALMRKLVTTMVEESPGLHTADTAMNGKIALEKIPKCDPDVICLDLEMPVMNGIEFLHERRARKITIPVIVLSSVAEKGAAITMQALMAGASDFITKPSGAISVNIHEIKERLAELLLSYGRRYKRFKKPAAVLPPLPKTTVPPRPLSQFTTQAEKKEPIKPVARTGKIEAVAIGISTGGPEALRKVLADIDPDLKTPILIVQHMPAGFTLEFARSLDKICPLDVTEAVDGEQVKPAHVYIAEGSKHLEVSKVGLNYVLHLTDTPLVSGH
jgi:two-component system chemotaxis response regulator CheB